MATRVFGMNIGGFEAFVLVFLVLAAVALWSTVKMVPQGYNYTVENFGRYTRTLNPGLHILVPVMWQTPCFNPLCQFSLTGPDLTSSRARSFLPIASVSGAAPFNNSLTGRPLGWSARVRILEGHGVGPA